MIFLIVALGIVIIALVAADVSLRSKVDDLQRSIKIIDKTQNNYIEKTTDLEDRLIKTEDSLNKVWHILKSQPRRQNKKPKQNTGSKQ